MGLGEGDRMIETPLGRQPSVPGPNRRERVLVAAAHDVPQRAGARMDQGVANRAVVRRALEAGFAERDLSAIAVFLRDLD